MKNYGADNVEEYIASSPDEAQLHLRELREIIKSTISGVEEKISWGIPFYWYHGALVGYASFKNHVSFGLGLSGLESHDIETLEKRGYKTGKKIIQIRFDQKVPADIIKQVLKSQASLNEAKRKTK